MRNKSLIYLCFFLSGAAGLMYEIIWTRFFSLTFGATTYSITTVLTAFMSGLALGSLLLGRVADRIKQRLLLYGWIELLVGLYALVFPVLFRLSSHIYLSLTGWGEVGSFQKLSLKFVLSFLIMLIPTTLMGGSLPLLSRFIIQDLKGVSSRLGLLYSVNTFGAVVGTYLVGFHLLSSIGLKASILVASLINISIGLAMILYAKKSGVEGKAALESSVPASPSPDLSLTGQERAVIRFAITAFMVSGFVSLSHEVVWTRILSLIIGSSTYAFTMILIGFLIGIALGSYVISHTGLIPLDRINLMLFSWIEIGIGISAYFLIPLFSKLPFVMLKAFQINPDNYNFITFYQFALSLLIVILPTTLMGATLPVIGKIVSREVQSVGASIGNIYFFNTFGAIFGSFFAGFLFIPYLGTLNTLKLGICINILLGMGGFLMVLSLHKKRAMLLVSLAASCMVLPIVWFSRWDSSLMDSGVSIYGKTMAENIKKNKKFEPGGKVLLLEEGINATISIRKFETGIYLKTNGKTDASTDIADMTTQTFSGYLPVMLHPNPRKALIIGLASGVTAGTVAQYDSIQTMDIVEIEPSIIKAASYFKDVNHHILEDPKAHIILNDGRNHLLETKEKYDLIISEPSNPWISGVASLFTTDYFKIAGEKLNPGGILCQWIQCYSISMENLGMVLNTVALSFKDVQLWTSDVGDLLLIGSNEKIRVDPARMESVMNYNQKTKTDFSDYMHAEYPPEIIGRLLLDREGILAFSHGARINSDNHPYLEFLAPRDLYLSELGTIYSRLSRMSQDRLPQPIEGIKDARDLALVYYHRGKVFTEIPDPKLFEEGKIFLGKALALDPTREDFYFQLGQIEFREKEYAEAEASIRKGLEINKTPKGIEMLVNYLSYKNKDVDALNTLEKNRGLLPAYESLYGKTLMKMGRYGEAIPYLKSALSKRQEAEYILMEKLGDCYREIRDFKTAEEYYIQSIKAEEMNPRSQFHLAELYFDQKKYEKALNIYLFLTEYWQDRRIYYIRMADCYSKLNQPEKADYILEKVLPKILPGQA